MKNNFQIHVDISPIEWLTMPPNVEAMFSAGLRGNYLCVCYDYEA